MPKISGVRLARIEKTLAADLGAGRRVALLEKIATDEAQHSARRARAFDGIYMVWRKAAMATPHRAAVFWERARIAAVKADALRINPSEIIRQRLDALCDGKPMPEIDPDPDLKADPFSPAARTIRERLDALAAAYCHDL